MVSVKFGDTLDGPLGQSSTHFSADRTHWRSLLPFRCLQVGKAHATSVSRMQGLCSPFQPACLFFFFFLFFVLFCLKEPKGEKLPSCKVLKEEMRIFIKMLKAGGESNVRTLACYLWD